MLKIVVFDSGYGGEFFADYLEKELPIVDVIRVIDWRNAEKIQGNPKAARKIAMEDLRPYIGKVDLIILANYLLAATSLKYFKRNFKNQRFVGLKLGTSSHAQPVLILTTKPLARTINYHNYVLRLKRKNQTLTFDDWPAKIDDGELTEAEIQQKILPQLKSHPAEVILACSQFYDIKSELKKFLGRSVIMSDGFQDTIREACKILRIRGGAFRKAK